MTAVTHPPKEAVRAEMERHRKEGKLPTPEEIRRQLGWHLIVPQKHNDR